MTEIAVATASQLEKIAEIEKECFTTPWSRHDLSCALSNPAFSCLAALNSGETCGYVIVCAAADEAEIINLAVERSSRRKGIAEMLMTAAVESAKQKGAVTMYLEVRASNTAAKSLYEKLGFSVIGTRRSYYKNPTEDALLMSKTL